MNRYDLQSAVFSALLYPLAFSLAGQPVWSTLIQVGVCLGMVAFAGRIERQAP